MRAPTSTTPKPRKRESFNGLIVVVEKSVTVRVEERPRQIVVWATPIIRARAVPIVHSFVLSSLPGETYDGQRKKFDSALKYDSDSSDYERGNIRGIAFIRDYKRNGASDGHKKAHKALKYDASPSSDHDGRKKFLSPSSFYERICGAPDAASARKKVHKAIK